MSLYNDLRDNTCDQGCGGWRCSAELTVATHCARRQASARPLSPLARFCEADVEGASRLGGLGGQRRLHCESRAALKDVATPSDTSTLSFNEWIVGSAGFSALPHGMYAPRIRTWRAYFGDALLVVAYHEFISAPAASLVLAY